MYRELSPRAGESKRSSMTRLRVRPKRSGMQQRPTPRMVAAGNVGNQQRKGCYGDRDQREGLGAVIVLFGAGRCWYRRMPI